MRATNHHHNSPEGRQGCWGFAHPVPSLDQLLRDQQSSSHGRPHPTDALRADQEAAVSYTSRLEASHAFTSNACVAAMAAALGLTDVTASLAGSLLGQQAAAASAAALAAAAAHTEPGKARSKAAAAARAAVWQQVDGAWAAEAVKQGVAHAKAGEQKRSSAAATASGCMLASCVGQQQARGLKLNTPK